MNIHKCGPMQTNTVYTYPPLTTFLIKAATFKAIFTFLKGEEAESVDDEAGKRLEAQKKLDEEYEKNLQEFYTDQKKFQEEHPDKVKQDFGKPDDLVSCCFSQKCSNLQIIMSCAYLHGQITRRPKIYLVVLNLNFGLNHVKTKKTA